MKRKKRKNCKVYEQKYCADLSGSLSYGYRCFEEVGPGITCIKHAKTNLTESDRFKALQEVVKILVKILKNPGSEITHSGSAKDLTGRPKIGFGLEAKLILALRNIDIKDLVDE